jgi:trk system potassium uptake protein TrkH
MVLKIGFGAGRLGGWVMLGFRFANPGQAIAALFAGAIALGTALLSLPISSADGQRTDFVDALFTSVSAVCVTGLVTVDTGSYWSTFGQCVILLLIQLGGLGIMTTATIVALLFFNRMGLRARSAIQVETKSISASDLRGVVRRIVIYSLAIECALATVLAWRFWSRYDYSLPDAMYDGVFHSVSAFNNAGFGLYRDNLMGFVNDPVILCSIAAAVVIGGLGFPVVFELVRVWRRPSRWSVLAKVTVVMTVFLIGLGSVVFYGAEASNPATLGGLSGPNAAIAAVFTAIMPRTAGFNAIDIAAMMPESLALTNIFMFIGGGSAGTAGGIKVTTVGLLAFVVWAELRGRTDVTLARRRVPSVNQRQALSVAMLGLVVVTGFFLTLLAVTDDAPDAVLFETIAAFGTVGLSTGITAGLSDPAKVLLAALMFIGRLGPLTLASALALRERPERTRLPEERIIVG